GNIGMLGSSLWYSVCLSILPFPRFLLRVLIFQIDLLSRNKLTEPSASCLVTLGKERHQLGYTI
ncbi:72_t:CDS:1, partial [Cetraspora pellucida]